MKNKLLLASLLAVCSVFQAEAAVIDFEDLTGQGAIPVGYQGLTWSANWEYYDFFQPPYTPASGVERAYNNDFGATPTFSFSSPVVFDGAYFSGNNNAAYEMYLSGSLVATSVTIGLSNVPTFLASGYAGQVDEVRLTGVSQGSFVIDDITYNGTAVPEPGSYPLLAVGLGVLALLRRKL